MRLKLLLLLISFFIIGIVLIGCGSSTKDNDLIVSSELLKTEKTLPDNFYELAEQGVMVYKVTNQDEFNALWDNFRLEGNPSEIDWNYKVAIFLGMIESGSCPFEFKFIELNSGKTEMVFYLQVDSVERACTDDATPRTIVIAMDADEVSDVTLVEIDNYNGSNPRVEFYKKNNKDVN